MDVWPARVARNILQLSQAQSLPAALREWRFNGEYEDHGSPIETCELCEQEELRYHFRIANQHSHHRLWVGSVCILRFNIAVFEDGQRLTEVQAKKHLDHLVKKMQHQACIKALETLASAESNQILKGALDYYKSNGHLTPKQANVVAWRLREHKIEHHPIFFKITLKRSSHKDDLRAMPVGRVHRLWPYLSASQRKLAKSMGFPSPV
jgi:hypothetical protein